EQASKLRQHWGRIRRRMPPDAQVNTELERVDQELRRLHGHALLSADDPDGLAAFWETHRVRRTIDIPPPLAGAIAQILLRLRLRREYQSYLRAHPRGRRRG